MDKNILKERKNDVKLLANTYLNDAPDFLLSIYSSMIHENYSFHDALILSNATSGNITTLDEIKQDIQTYYIFLILNALADNKMTNYISNEQLFKIENESYEEFMHVEFNLVFNYIKSKLKLET